MAQLRAPGGCPWDREQTFDSIKPYTLEETYEVLDAIDARDWDGLREELGDFTLQAIFYAQMAAEGGHFSIGDSLDAINQKLIRRHPHVFGDVVAETPDAVVANWEAIKAIEKAHRTSVLDGIPGGMPGLALADKVLGRAAKVGVTVDAAPVPASEEEEVEIVRLRTASLGKALALPGDPPALAEIRRVVTIFRELRAGQTTDGRTKVKSPSSTLSPAEAISVIGSGMALASHFGNGCMGASDVASGLVGAIVKDPVQDQVAWEEYLETVVKERSGWKDLYRACREQDGSR